MGKVRIIAGGVIAAGTFVAGHSLAMHESHDKDGRVAAVDHQETRLLSSFSPTARKFVLGQADISFDEAIHPNNNGLDYRQLAVGARAYHNLEDHRKDILKSAGGTISIDIIAATFGSFLIGGFISGVLTFENE